MSRPSRRGQTNPVISLQSAVPPQPPPPQRGPLSTRHIKDKPSIGGFPLAQRSPPTKVWWERAERCAPIRKGDTGTLPLTSFRCSKNKTREHIPLVFKTLLLSSWMPPALAASSPHGAKLFCIMLVLFFCVASARLPVSMNCWSTSIVHTAKKICTSACSASRASINSSPVAG